MRTKKSIYNFISDVFPFFIISALSFFRIRFVLDSFGTEINGLLQLVVQIFSYLTLAEAGFGTAVMYKLYKPLAENKKNEIISIVNGSKKIFKKIALIMTISSIICAFLLPLFIAKGSLNNSFIINLFLFYAAHYLIEYFLVLPYTTLLQADQNQYIFNTYKNITRIIFLILELVLIYNKINLIIIISINIIFTLIYAYLITKRTHKMYPWLKDKCDVIDISSISMTKDVFVHKISSLVFSKTDSIILSLFSLNYVTIYTSYNYILDFLTNIVSKIYGAVKSSYINIVVLNKADEDKKFFNMFLSFSFFLAIFCAITFHYTVNPVINLWIGEKYTLSESSVLLFTLIIIGRIIINPVYIARDSKGLYKETKIFTIAQAIVNIVLSLILVKKYKIFGVLLATVISQYFILIPCNIRIVYKKVINENFNKLIKNVLIMLFSAIILIFINNIIKPFYMTNSLMAVIIYMLSVSIINFIILIIIYFWGNKDFKKLLLLLKNYLNKSGKKVKK